MNQEIIAAIHETYAASSDGKLHFGQVVGQLIQAGVEAYHVDYRGRRATYYLPDGQAHTIETGGPELQIPEAFDPDALVRAIRGAQAGNVKYPEFKLLSQAAGCVSYTVWISGRHVIYFGRRGESHIEKFPDRPE
ncbi:DUF1398 domain-containing protein [Undibacterium sp. TJN25]|uniref:DUF1398 domain-containing protein n=1 Tax=Undibacterium sp. TJN25 TaxID=3413056 RepID=UPI003BF1CFEB